jgi:c-di-GMP-binding flagellar brake protein YcgR
MLEKVLRINYLVDVLVDDGNKQQIYRSRVEGLDKQSITLANPIKDSVLVPLREGLVVNITFLDDTAIYSFDSVIISRHSGNLPTITVKYPNPTAVKRTQRRNFVRFDTKLKISFNLIKDYITDYTQTFTGETIDVSGGGLMMATDTDVPKEELVDVQLELGSDNVVSAVGRVVRLTDRNDQSNPRYLLGLVFDVIEEKDRDKIIRFIFEKQRELRQRGLL